MFLCGEAWDCLLTKVCVGVESTDVERENICRLQLGARLDDSERNRGLNLFNKESQTL